MKQVCLIIFILSVAITINAQELKKLSGTQKFKEGDYLCCFSQSDWEVSYKFECRDIEIGSVLLVLSNAKNSHSNGKFMYKGKEYAPSALGLSEWPAEYKENKTLRFKLTIMHGTDVLKEQTVDVYVTNNNTIKIGQYNNGLFSTFGANSRKIDGFNYKNCTISASEIACTGCYNGGQSLVELIEAKQKSKN